MGLLAVASLGGCFEDAQPKIAPRLVETVAVSRAEPGASCQPLGAVEGRSSDDDDTYQSAYQSVRERAALRGGNYVVIDAISGPLVSVGGVYDSSVVIRGRLYACSIGWSTRAPSSRMVAQAPGPMCGE
jgi:hypothetical protein